MIRHWIEDPSWTPKRRMALVLSILRGDIMVAEAAYRNGLDIQAVEDWRRRFLLGAEQALREPGGKQDARLGRVERSANEILREFAANAGSNRAPE